MTVPLLPDGNNVDPETIVVSELVVPELEVEGSAAVVADNPMIPSGPTKVVDDSSLDDVTVDDADSAVVAGELVLDSDELDSDELSADELVEAALDMTTVVVDVYGEDDSLGTVNVLGYGGDADVLGRMVDTAEVLPSPSTDATTETMTVAESLSAVPCRRCSL